MNIRLPRDRGFAADEEDATAPDEPGGDAAPDEEGGEAADGEDDEATASDMSEWLNFERLEDFYRLEEIYQVLYFHPTDR